MQSFNYIQPNQNQYNVVQQQQHPIQQTQHVQHVQQHIQQHMQHQQYPMHQIPAHNLIMPQYIQDMPPQQCQPIYFEPLAPVYIKNQLLPSPMMVQMPTTVVVQNEAQPAMVLNQPASNIVVKNTAPSPVYVKQSSPNVIVKNEAPPNYIQGMNACQDTVVSENNMNRQIKMAGSM